MKGNQIFTILFLCLSIHALGQEDVSQYFDDGGLSNTKNQVKVNLAAMINGDFTVSYQREVINPLHIEVGVGYLSDDYLIDRNGLSENYLTQDHRYSVSGYSFFFNPKLRYKGDGALNLYLGLKYRNRKYTQDQLEILSIQDYVIHQSAEIIIGQRLILDLGFGFGYGLVKSNVDRFVILAFPLDLKVGYTF